MFWDLHFHSTDSDGLFSNDHIITQIQSIDPHNQGIWAMTNHDCYSPGFVLPAWDAGIHAIWATEISAHSKELDTSLHITCYTPRLSESIRQLVDGVLVGKTQKVRKQILLLESNGFPIGLDSFMNWTLAQWYRPITLSNAHITQYLFDKQRKDETLRVLAQHTQSTIVDGTHFLDECLKKTGNYRHLGSIEIEPYEPELSDLMSLAQHEDMVLSVAHPNFSFHPIYKRAAANANIDIRWDHFYSHILPVLDELGIRNYEINTMATPEQARAIHAIVEKRNGLITYGSDNHGYSKPDSKHGLLWVQNPYLTSEMLEKTRTKLRSFITH